MSNSPNHPIVLGSSSPYRRTLLSKIIRQFDVYSPSIDEKPYAGEKPAETAHRLAVEKAIKTIAQYPQHIAIASDQVAVLSTPENTADITLNKPKNHKNALHQLEQCVGNSVTYHTACCVINDAEQQQYSFIDQYTLVFRNNIDRRQLNNYLEREQPYDCAGSIKAEELGVALIREHKGQDPCSLMGLPLIKLIDVLASMDIDVLS